MKTVLHGNAVKSPPFSIRLLEKDPVSASASSPDKSQFTSLLPASYYTESDNLTAASHNIIPCIKRELDVQRLTKVFNWLWVAGRPSPPRPLHYQLLLGREILLTEQMDMHLVWATDRIFLKPVPRFLLEPDFWDQYLCCDQVCRCPPAARATGAPTCQLKTAGKCALGFLFSYVALIRHESDFLIAKEKYLVPKEIEWEGWITFVQQIDTEYIYPKIDPRFLYGELRLSRLNKIYFLSQRLFLHGYMSQWQQYGSFFHDNLAWVASAIVYIAVVLAAMQVGLGTEYLANNDAFQSVSYGLTMLSILGPLVAFALILLVFCFAFVKNWIMTIAYKQKRFYNIGVELEAS